MAAASRARPLWSGILGLVPGAFLALAGFVVLLASRAVTLDDAGVRRAFGAGMLLLGLLAFTTSVAAITIRPRWVVANAIAQTLVAAVFVLALLGGSAASLFFLVMAAGSATLGYTGVQQARRWRGRDLRHVEDVFS